MPSADIRTLTAADAQDYRRIRLAALEREPDAFGSNFAAEAARPLDHFTERLTTSVVLAAYAGERIIGMAGYKQHEGLKERHKAFVWGTYVEAAHRREGVALGLMGALMQSAASLVEQLTLMVVRENAAAVALYRRCGFDVYGIEPRALRSEKGYADEVLMVRFLAGLG